MPIDELTAIERVLAGDRQAFRHLVEANSPRVYTAVLRIVRDSGAAEEIAQDAFLQAYRSLATFRREAVFTTWLLRIAINKALDYCRSQGSRPPVDRDPADIASCLPSPETQVLVKEEIWQLREQVQALPPVYRRVIHQYYFRELSYKQIAQAEGVTEKTVESRLYRAKALLRKSLEGGEGNVSAPRP